MTHVIRHFAWQFLAVASIGGRAPLCAADIAIPMEPARWQLEAGEFLQHKGVPALRIPTPSKAVLKDLVFRDGTIEFDMEPGSYGGPGVGFRRAGPGEFEYFYLRPGAKGPGAGDACQYAPFIKNVLIWDLLPRFQGPAPFRLNDWNHVRIVVSGARARIYVNQAARPVLDIGRLEGSSSQGGIVLNGPAIFANLRVRPGVTNGLPPQPAAESIDRSVVRDWSVSPFKTLLPSQDLSANDIPSATPPWRPLRAERAGLLNLTREYGLPEGRSAAWLRTHIDRQADGEAQVAIGWSEEVWVFVNGKMVFSGKNRYLIPEERKEPDGRCAPTNGTFRLPLKRGRNDVVVAVANGFFGWGLIFKMVETQPITSR
ncbi:hypothetical protein [uncultured Paludibaculum sp.]|uniref:hypothetical protein n=1 Tax=uncultured Paludibaculum sp. TaxID=1765020 RepID=UPI002AAB1EB9|nr:hypothetical protein [uncultured Paludibaculum sp.]